MIYNYSVCQFSSIFYLSAFLNDHAIKPNQVLKIEYMAEDDIWILFYWEPKYGT